MPLRTGNTICPHAPRRRGRQPIWQDGSRRGRRGVVGDHATLVSPAMARVAAPWWGSGEEAGGFFVDEPLPRSDIAMD